MLYAVVHISFFDYELKMEFVEAETELEAVDKGLRKMEHVYGGKTGFEDCTSLKEARYLAWYTNVVLEVKAVFR